MRPCEIWGADSADTQQTLYSFVFPESSEIGRHPHRHLQHPQGRFGALVECSQDSAANIVGESAEVCCQRFEETEVEEEGDAGDTPADFFAEE